MYSRAFALNAFRAHRACIRDDFRLDDHRQLLLAFINDLNVPVLRHRHLLSLFVYAHVYSAIVALDG